MQTPECRPIRTLDEMVLLRVVTMTTINPREPPGVFDFFDIVYRTDEEDIYRPFMHKLGSDEFYSSYAKWRTYQMSDHLPMWIELYIDFTQEYLDEVEADIQAILDN